MTDLKPLSRKHQRVLDEYLVCFIQWRAYKKVYPKSSDEVCRTQSSVLFAKPNFSAHLSARMDEAHMAADEVLKLLADQARGDLGDFVDRLGQLDLQSAKDAGISRLIKKFKQRTITKIGKGEKDDDTEIHDVEIELYDAQAALQLIGKHHKLFSDQVDVNHRLTVDGLSDVLDKIYGKT